MKNVDQEKGIYATYRMDPFLLIDIFFKDLLQESSYQMMDVTRNNHKNVIPFSIAAFAVFARMCSTINCLSLSLFQCDFTPI